MHEVASLLSVSQNQLSKCHTRLSGFPRSVAKRGRSFLWDRDAVLAYGHGKAVKTLCWQVLRVKPASVENPFNQHLCRQFLVGQFLTEEQKQQLAFKKLVARSTQPKTRRVRLMFDWMLDDNDTGNRRPRKTKQEAA